MNRSLGRFFKITLIIMMTTLLLFGDGTGRVTGTVTDTQKGMALPGANIVVEGSALGAAANLQGEFTLFNVPAGQVITLVINYIGYQEKKLTLELERGETKVVDVELDILAIEGEEVIVTGQAAGQRSAINQQVSAKTVKNIVSSQQIQELPEANAAEAVGRLPGVSLERSGGEGTKVMIRGMGAKYTTVQIDGVNMTATGSGDRSSDLSMISPYMLEGIELTKSVMANQEATATGGIVNFKIRKAPEKQSFNVILQGGQNNLRNTYSDYKLSIGGSKRFVSNLLGLYAQVDYENKDAGSQQLGAVNFSQENEEAPVKTNSMQLREIFRNVKRLGGALVVDYTLPSTEIKSSNFFSRINREHTTFTNSYDFTQQGFSLNYEDTPESWLTVITNSIQLDHSWRNFHINSAFSHSYSENVLPARISSNNNNSPANPFPTDRDSKFNVNLDPETIPDSLAISMDEVVRFMHLGGITHEESETMERDLGGEINLDFNFNITDFLNVKVSAGTKIKHKEKEYDRTNLQADNQGGSQSFRNLIYEGFEDELSDRTKNAWADDNMRILIEDFMDDDYDGEEFLDGRYDFGYVFDKDDFRRIHDLVMDQYDYDASVSDMYAFPHTNFENSVFQDYNGTEDYLAFYLMPEINIGRKFMIVPGVRYEQNKTEYTGYRGNRLGVLRNWRATPVDTVTKVRENDFVLPMIQTFFKPLDWLTIKAGYTHTLQRPNYNNIMPGWMINTQGSIWNLSNFQLKPELSQNLDLQVSVHSDKVGLFSVGVFHKRIEDMIFWTGNTVILDTAFFELPELMYRQIAAYATNNPNEAINYGFEVEYQSNFWFLPGLWKGLVLNMNYTRNKSEAKYLKTRIEQKLNEFWQVELIPNDTTYTAPMIGQPDHLLNITLGYDYKGFSIRGAMRYKSKIFTNNNWYEKLRGYSSDFYRYDLSIKQRINKQLEVFLNVNNLTGELERNEIKHMGFATYIEDYGRSANLGIRFNL